MITISNNLNNSDAFSSFREKKLRYTQSPKGESEVGEKYIDRYIKIVKNNPKKFTIAGVSALIIGGTGIFINKNAMRTRLNQGINIIKENASMEIPAKGWDKAKEYMNELGFGVFNSDTIKNMISAMLIKNKYTGKVGETLFNWSKISLKATSGMAKSGYKSWTNKVGTLAGDVEKTITTGDITNKEKQLLEELQNFIKEKGLGQLAKDLEKGFDGRIKKLQGAIDEKHIQPFKDKYIPKSLRWSELKRVWNNLKKGMFKKELVRENWNKTLEDVLEKEINNAGGGKLKEINNAGGGKLKEINNAGGGKLKEINNAGGGKLKETIDNLDDIYKKMTKFQNPSKDFKKIIGQLKTKEDLSFLKIRSIKDFKELISQKGIIDGFEELKNFEMYRYAGREIDLAVGGGVPEFLMPVAVGVPLTYNIVKDSEPDKKFDTFMKKGGVAFVGGLSVWSTLSVLFGVNGLPAILAGAVSGIVLDQIGKGIYKFVNKDDKPKQAENKPQKIVPPKV